jgi:hypothetical protein
MNETPRRSLLRVLCLINALSAMAAYPLMLAAVSYGKTVVISRYHGLEVDGVVETTSIIPPLYGSEKEPDVPEHLTYALGWFGHGIKVANDQHYQPLPRPFSAGKSW